MGIFEDTDKRFEKITKNTISGEDIIICYLEMILQKIEKMEIKK